MGIVVLHNIPDSLVEEGKEGGESPHTCEVHDVFKVGCGIFKALHNQAIWGKVWPKNGSNIPLYLMGWKRQVGK